MAFVAQSWLCSPESTLLLSMCTSVWNSGDDVSLHLWALPCLEQHKSLNWAEMFVFGLLPLFSLTFHVNCHQRKSLYSVPLHNPGSAISLLLNTWCGWEQVDCRDHHPCYISWINRWRAAARCSEKSCSPYTKQTRSWSEFWSNVSGLALSGGAVVAMPMTSSSN